MFFMKKIILFLTISTLFLSSCKDEHNNLKDGLYAEIVTNKGTIIVQLDYDKAPITVANFVSLAEGKNPFVTKEFKDKPFFNGLKFHRVIENFMIQGGDPLGNGSGDAGYKFKDEITDLRFDKGGLLAMANSGPATNSSQFFITHLETPWLDGKHTIFGHVVENGMEVVNSIVQDDNIKEINIIRKGIAAKEFKADKIFSDYFKAELEDQQKQAAINEELNRINEIKYKTVRDQKVTYFKDIITKATKTSSGLMYKITSKANGKKPAHGSAIYINYSGFLENGNLFDTSNAKDALTFGKFDQQRADANQYLPIPFQAGRKDGMIPGFIEGIEKMAIGDKAILFIPANLAYGAQGAGNVIPPNSNIIFEVELLDESMYKN